MALAREPGGVRDFGDRAVVVAQEIQRTLDPPFQDKSVRRLSDRDFERLDKVMRTEPGNRGEFDEPELALVQIASTSRHSCFAAQSSGLKQRITVMLGFKRLANAAITIAGIELLHRIRKEQFKLRPLGVQGRTAPAVWNAVLQA